MLVLEVRYTEIKASKVSRLDKKGGLINEVVSTTLLD